MVRTADLLGYALHYPPNGCVRFQGTHHGRAALQDLISALAEQHHSLHVRTVLVFCQSATDERQALQTSMCHRYTHSLRRSRSEH